MKGLRWLMALFVAGPAWLAVTPAYGAVAPPNDNYLSSAIIPASETTGTAAAMYNNVEDTTAATTQPDLFNPEQNGLPFAGGGPEPLSCDGFTYGNTVWYDLHPQIDEGVQLQASGYLNVIAVYQFNKATAKIVRLVSCQGSTTTTHPNVVTLPFDIQKGDLYTVQVGGVQTGAAIASGTLNFSATFYPDRDGDRVPDTLDACLSLSGVRRFGGCPPTIHPVLSYTYVGMGGSAIKLTTFSVANVPTGARVTVKCSCGLGQVRTSGPHAHSVTVPALVGATVRSGSTIRIWTTKRATHKGIYQFGAIGAFRQFTVDSAGLTAGTKGCLMPGSMTPRPTCPPGGRRHIP